MWYIYLCKQEVGCGGDICVADNPILASNKDELSISGIAIDANDILLLYSSLLRLHPRIDEEGSCVCVRGDKMF